MESHYEEYLWMDKHRPRAIKDLEFNKGVNEILKSLAQKDDFPHLIFYGPDGAGKRTRIRLFLALIYGNGVFKVNNETRDLKVNSTNVEYQIVSSNYHIELDPSEADSHDRVIVQKVIKETSSVSQFDQKTQKSFKVIVLHQVDNLTKEAQAALRRTMEKYSRTCRIVMSCCSLNKIIPPIRSRCLSIRVPCPSEKEIKLMLTRMASQEGISVSEHQIDLIVKNSDRNIRRGINSLQLTSLETYSKDIYIPEYTQSIKTLCADIMKNQSAQELKKEREVLYKLLINGLSAEEIILLIAKELCLLVNKDSQKNDIIHWAAIFDNRSANGTKAIIHLEAFLARVMLIISNK